ncbi:SbcC/MukB-like Walker B domain-containing protein [Algiphilus sp.]|uniref:SbcC/MukB-like Walker B domain-containing protein n=1 Tax=Algiphilus sp. TaxID=1872431 RepID=UPI0032ED34A2
MKALQRVVLVQYYLHEEYDVEIEGSTAFLGPNGSGKSSTLDAIQIAMLGGNQRHLRFNTQSVSSKNRRTLAGYCLGLLRSPDEGGEIIGRARDVARTYIALVFGDGTPDGVLSAGLCMEADIETGEHENQGLFVLPGQELCAADCIERMGDERCPIAYSDFKEQRRAHAQAAGRTPTFTDKSSEYVRELLYALSGQHMPDPDRFMTSFVKSMTLKNVDSVDQFVRNHVIEPNPVKIDAFRKQVEQFVQLRNMIQETKARLSRLQGILGDFSRARSAERRLAALDAIKAIFDHEYLSEQIDNVGERINTLRDQSSKATAQVKKDEQRLQAKRGERETLKAHLDSDASEQERRHLMEKISSQEAIIHAYQEPAANRANRLINALRAAIDDLDLRDARSTIQETLRALTGARESNDPGATLGALRHRSDSFSDIQKAVKALVDRLNRDKDRAAQERDNTRATIQVIGNTGRMMNDGAVFLHGLLERHGIESQPVSALARITDQSWAPAIERYLGDDRDALVVLDGDTREAVRILREARQRGGQCKGAAIVQPAHLQRVDISPRSADYVLGVLDADNETARRFLWNRFGSMRLVSTEEELERFARALTQDGMLSQNGLTKSIGTVSKNDLRIGHAATDTASLTQHVLELENEIAAIDKRVRPLDELLSVLSAFALDGDEDAARKIEAVASDVDRLKSELERLDVSHLDEVREAVETLDKEIEACHEDYLKALRLEGGLDEQIKAAEREHANLASQVDGLLQKEREARYNPLIDPTQLDETKDEIERTADSYEKRLEGVDSRVENNRSRLKSAHENASIALSQYISDHRLDVQLLAMGWHERYDWANNEKDKLQNTDLANYEAQAEVARKASEDTLRSDIAMSLNDRFNEMELERRERNKILDACPAFTGGERYRFTATVVPHYKELVDYIKYIAKNDQQYALLGDNASEVNKALSDLVEAAAESSNAEAVLDYRQFFTYDLDIIVDGHRVDRMSNRQGAGSNGEHIAPMYIAAGAALAKAYRLHNRKGEQAAMGVMCLDEAFHGMDTTNAVATARFLQSLGMQLIMAGPELERTKLQPITQTIYDLDREGTDLLMERTRLKPAANALMVSDFPSENPAIEQEAYQQLGLTPPTEERDDAVRVQL